MKPVASSASTSGLITKEQLLKIFTNGDPDYLKKVADEFNVDPAKYGLGTVLRRAHFFAQLLEEASNALKATVESMNYTPDGLKVTFMHYKNHPKEADQDGRHTDAKTKMHHAAAQETIANKVYCNRLGNGAVSSGDGWKFRGRGFIQVTGRNNYRAIAAQYKKLYAGAAVDFEQNPDLVKDFPYSARSAVCFWVMNGLPSVADHGSADADVDAVTAVVNVHTNSYEDRRAHFKLTYATFK